MYERNAIVLERYFYKIFDFKSKSNLKENYYHYRKLFECYGSLCSAIEKEELCQREYNEASQEITNLQKLQEKLYNKSAKFEYSRYIIFSNIEEKVENIEKHLNRVNEDVQNNGNDLKALGEKFVQAVDNYNTKKANLEEAILARENAQKEYDRAFEEAQACFDEMPEKLVEDAKYFIESDNKETKKELQETFEENGKNEKNPFDPDVIANTINKSIDIYKIEMDIYLSGLDRMAKLFEEIDSNSVKNDKHMKYYRDSKAKIDFLNAEKEYIVQFLDNERLGAIYDKKAHRKLMLEACKKFALDFAQIEKLYEIIIKEIAGRSTKKIYKENYNKEYLVELENASVEPSLDTGKMRQEAIAFVNLNYWRVEGMKSVYSAFEEIVTTIYEKDLSEFIPEELKQVLVEQAEKVENTPEVVKHRKIFYSSKISLVNAIYRYLQKDEFAETEEEIVENVQLEEVLPQEEKKYSISERMEEIFASDDEEEEEENIIKSSVPVKESIPENKFAVEEAVLEDDIEEEEAIPEIDFEEEKIIPSMNWEEESDLDSNLEVKESIPEINFEEEEKENVPENILEEESVPEIDFDEDDDEETALFEDLDDEENTFDLSKLDEIEDSEEFIQKLQNIPEVKEKPKVEEVKEKQLEEVEEAPDEEEDSILEIYFNNEDDDISEDDLNKKVGLFKKLVGFNSKKKREA